MTYGKVISLFLVDGDPSARWICDLSNWTGVGFRIPRQMLSESKDLDRITSPGVYFLIGKTDDESKTAIYIGEAEDVHYRLVQHVNAGEKEWQEWNDCVAFCSKDTSLNKAKIKYLENALFILASKSNRCEVINGNTPTRSSLSAKDEAETTEYLEMLKIVLGSMGYRFLQPFSPLIPKQKTMNEYPVKEDDAIFYCTYPKIGCDAKGMIVPEGILVLKGSRIRDGDAPSFRDKNYCKLKFELIKSGVIIDNVFTKDHLFSSYSAASSVICGHNTNGRLSWVDKNNRTIAECFDRGNNDMI